MRETHSAVVLLVGDLAFKLKKPVDLGFLDFTTLRARKLACRREVTLNRRLAPDVYLGIAVVTGPERKVCDHLVVMRRMPEDRRLAALVRAGTAGDDEMRRIARLIAAFHARARRGEDIAREGGRDALRDRWTASFDQVAPFHGVVLPAAEVEEVRRLASTYLAGREQLFADRVTAGRIVDGHGDLLAEDIFCLPDGPRVLDCLEFDDRLRHLDGLDDAAFLAMDLEALGAPELATRYLHLYREYSADPAPASLLDHYLAYRAFVRVKVACLRHAQGDPDAAPAARHLLDVALRHLRRGAVRLVLVGGLPGTGKSTLAGELADRLGLVLLSSDLIRKEQAGLAPDVPAPAAYRHGLYTPARTAEVYRELLHRAGAALVRGESVVLDASWTRAADRAAATALAAETSSAMVALECAAPAACVSVRLADRSGPSDADAAIARAMAQDTDRWPEAHLIDTGGRLGESVERAVDLVTLSADPPGRNRCGPEGAVRPFDAQEVAGLRIPPDGEARGVDAAGGSAYPA